MKTDFQQEYIEEAKQVLKGLQQSLLQLGTKEAGQEEVNNVYRYLHTLKGSAGMFGFQTIEQVSHELENVFSDIRDGVRQHDDFIIDLTLHAADVISDLLDGKDVVKAANKIVSDLRTAVGDNATVANGQGTTEKVQSFAVILKPEKEIFKRGINFNSILEEILRLGNHDLIIHKEIVPFQKQMATKEITSWFEIIIVTPSGCDAIKDVLMFMSQKEYDIIELTSEAFVSGNYRQHIELSGAELLRRQAILEDLLPAMAVGKVVQETTDEIVTNDHEEEPNVVIRKAKRNGAH